MSSSSVTPPHRPQWMYARGKTWATFSKHDSDTLEQQWQQLGGEHWVESLSRKQSQTVDDDGVGDDDGDNNDGGDDGQTSPSTSTSRPKLTSRPSAPPSGVDAIHSAFKRFTNLSDDAQPNHHDSQAKVMVQEILDPDQPESERAAKVQVMQDHLFDVDLQRMVLYPVFWKGVLLKVVRATWFYSSATDGSYAPISWDDPLADDLNVAYDMAKPWLHPPPKDGDKQHDTQEQVQAQAPLWPLPSIKEGGNVCFQDAFTGRIFSKDIVGRFMSILGGSTVVRGFDKAQELVSQNSNSSLFNLSLPWAAENEDDNHDHDHDGQDVQARQKNGSTLGASTASKLRGAAQTDSKPVAGGGSDESNPSPPSDTTDQINKTPFFGGMTLLPSADAFKRPAIALMRLLGMSKQPAFQEEERRIKQKSTEQGTDSNNPSSRNDDDDRLDINQDLKDEPPQLVFVIHGIGQQLTEDFDAVDFVYDVEKLRNGAAEQAADPAIRHLARGRRAQFIPICWRRSLTFDHQPEDNDNFYTLQDITNSSAIPMVRNLISKVVLDVPFYLSFHRQKMIDSVISELNRTYRLFCRRNPDFETKGGRVSIIGHSLGSALSCDILSNQPSRVPLLAEVEQQNRAVLQENKHLHFNVKNLFWIGSPVAFFFYLNGGQMIARRGTDRNPAPLSEQPPDDDGEMMAKRGIDPNPTTSSERQPDDATLNVVGKYGCLATETVYNIYNPTDPVAFQLAPTVDAQYASMVQPISIQSSTSSLLEALALPRLSVTKLFEKYRQHPFQAVGKLVHRASLFEESQPDQVDLSEEEKQLIAQRKLGREITNASEYLEKARRMQKLDQARENNHVIIKFDTSQGSSCQPTTTIPPPLSTEVGSIKKQLQPKQSLQQAHKQGIIDKHNVDWNLDSLQRGERRFRALNPHGSIDFILSSNIAFSEYLDMIGAHVCYWTHPDFATFLLTQLFMDWHDDNAVTLVPRVEIADQANREEKN